MSILCYYIVWSLYTNLNYNIYIFYVQVIGVGIRRLSMRQVDFTVVLYGPFESKNSSRRWFSLFFVDHRPSDIPTQQYRYYLLVLDDSRKRGGQTRSFKRVDPDEK